MNRQIWKPFAGIAIIWAYFAVAWMLLQLFPGTPMAHWWVYGLAGSLLMAKATQPPWRLGRDNRRWEGTAFVLSLAFSGIITWILWKPGCQLETMTCQLRTGWGAALGIGTDAGFQAFFMAALFIFLCLVASTIAIWAKLKKR